MARPIKNNCDYFPHDSNMRNHRKVKAIRTTFGMVGYGIWTMFLEYLTGADGNVFEFSDMEMEFLSGDFGVSVAEIRDVLNYCVRIELLFVKNGFIHSESLDERLKPVYDKRGYSKELSKKQKRENGKFTVDTVVSVAEIPNVTVDTVEETPQKKVNKSKVNKTIYSAEADFNFDIILNPPKFPNWRNEVSEFLSDEYFIQQWVKAKGLKYGEVVGFMREFVTELNLSGDFKKANAIKIHFKNHYEKHYGNKVPKGNSGALSNAFIEVPKDFDYSKLPEGWE